MPRELEPCGTRAAYQRHRRAGEEPCGPCREAMRAANRQFEEARPTRKRNRRELKPCGTRAAYARHRRNGEKPWLVLLASSCCSRVGLLRLISGISAMVRRRVMRAGRRIRITSMRIRSGSGRRGCRCLRRMMRIRRRVWIRGMGMCGIRCGMTRRRGRRGCVRRRRLCCVVRRVRCSPGATSRRRGLAASWRGCGRERA